MAPAPLGRLAGDRLSRRALVLAAVFGGAFALLLVIGRLTTDGGWGADDQGHFHLPLVNHFLAEGFRLDYPSTSATSPGTHLVVAGLARALGLSRLEAASPLIPAFFAAVAALTLTLVVGYVRAVGRNLAVALAFGFAVLSSSYFLRPSLFLVTEGLAYLGYAGLLGVLVFLPHGLRAGALWALAGSLMVLSRQVFLPVVLAYGLHALPIRPARILRDWPGIAAAVLVPMLALLPFLIAWGGLVPPEFARHETGGLNWPVIPHNVALVGILAVPFLLLSRGIEETLRQPWLVVPALALALALWLAIPHDHAPAEGRYFSAIWQLAEFSPRVLDRALLLLPPIALGCLAVVHYLRAALDAGRIPVEWVMFGLYTAALCGQAFAWQRYAEVPLLMTLGISTAFLLRTAPWRLAAFLAAFGLYFALSLAAMTGLLSDVI